MRILTDLQRQHSREAQIVLGAAVLDDVLGVIILALLYEFSISGGISVTNAGKVTLFVGVFFVVAPFAAKAISLIIKRFDAVNETRGLISTTIVSLVLLFAWLAHAAGRRNCLAALPPDWHYRVASSFRLASPCRQMPTSRAASSTR